MSSSEEAEPMSLATYLTDLKSIERELKAESKALQERIRQIKIRRKLLEGSNDDLPCTIGGMGLICEQSTVRQVRKSLTASLIGARELYIVTLDQLICVQQQILMMESADGVGPHCLSN